jgi:predicted CXXCH cytochrome family protein
MTSPNLWFATLLVSFILSFLPNNGYAVEFVGSEQCQTCHKKEFSAWQGSHHDMAMKHADKQSVLGDFDNVSFNDAGKVNKFYKNKKQFWVNIKGPDGEFHDYQIKYTFGFEPLQQYMVEFDDGRVQLIPFAWDSRTKAQGGQRWFNLYPEFTENHQDFFWTNKGQNWNYMCADCHSTNVSKNFDVKTNSYKTKFSEINVGCEACHGPASKHMDWSKVPDNSVNDKGFSRNISKKVTEWVQKEGFNTLRPKAIHNSQQTLVCAQCHSRRTQISNNNHIDKNEFGEKYLLSLITNDNYYSDGQIYNENFIYGSFLQSKMAKNGVVCSNCHDPHTAKLIMPEKVVCLQCHQASSYAQKSHHQHQDNSTGAQCVSCHMPETTYMEIDNRRDHGWHKPTPSIAKKFSTPDTCLSCHENKDSDWSSQYVSKWFNKGNTTADEPFAPIFAIADGNYQNVTQQLSKIAQSQEYAAIIRASALARMANTPDTNTLIAIARNVKHSDSNIRRGAIDGAVNIKPAEKWRILSPLLTDSVLAVRSEAAMALVSLWSMLSTEQKSDLQPALADYIAIQDYNADRGYAHTNKAIVLGYQNKINEAFSSYQQSMRIEPYFAPAYVNMAELHKRQGQNKQAIEILEQGNKANPSDSSIPYSLGLAYIRAKDISQAQRYLKMAAELAKTNARYYYVYALSLASHKPSMSEKSMHKAYELSGDPQHLYALCEMQVNRKAFEAKQCLSTLEKVAPANVVSALRQRLTEK